MIAAPSSGAGKTTVTLALIAALRAVGHEVATAKAGPDYIDPAYHTAAAGHPCFNLDPWAMRQASLASIIAHSGHDVDVILAEGINPGQRRQVHLSTDTETATKVGQRHGKPVVLRVDTGRMAAEGHLFYFADNGVWLTDHVPSQYLGFGKID